MSVNRQLSMNGSLMILTGIAIAALSMDVPVSKKGTTTTSGKHNPVNQTHQSTCVHMTARIQHDKNGDTG